MVTTTSSAAPPPDSCDAIRTTNDVLKALTDLALPLVDQRALSTISSLCRERFLTALLTCKSGRDVDGQARGFLENVLTLCSESTQAILSTEGIAASTEDLIQIALFRPKRFRSALSILVEPSSSRRNEAIEYLRSIVGTKPWKISPHPDEQYSECSGGSRSAVGKPQRPLSNLNNGIPIYRSHHVYGSEFALCFNASQAPDGVPAVMVDAACILPSKQADWSNATHIMLDVREIGSVLAVFRRRRRGVEFKFHGKQRDKSFLLENQGAHFFCRVQRQRSVRAVQILPHDALKVSLLFSEQLLLAYPHLPSDLVLDMAMSVNDIDAPLPAE